MDVKSFMIFPQKCELFLFFFFFNNLGDKKEKGKKRLLRETETSKVSFDRVTECIFNL